jgi:hypothetical protein
MQNLFCLDSVFFLSSHRMNLKYYLNREFWATRQVEISCIRRKTGNGLKLQQYDEWI